MGYCVEVLDMKVRIRKENLEEAYRRMCALNDRTDLKHSGSMLPDGTWSSFSWIHKDYPEQCIDAREIFEELRFQCVEADGTLIIHSFIGEKIGDEDIFFKEIEDLVEDGSYAEWLGEDGERWKWFFNGSGMEIKQGKVSYD